MRLRSARSARFPWNSVLLFLVGVAVGAVLMALAVAPQVDPQAADAPRPSPTITSPAGDALRPTQTSAAVVSPESTPDQQSGATAGEQPTTAATTAVAATSAAPTTVPTSNASTTTQTLTRDQIEAAVTDAVERFQDAKEAAQKTGDTSLLNRVLAGQALERQIALVDATTAAGCYWEISLTQPLRVEFIEVRSDNYAFVRVYKTENRSKYCDGELVASAENDSYSTTYVVERIGDAWYVTERE